LTQSNFALIIHANLATKIENVLFNKKNCAQMAATIGEKEGRIPRNGGRWMTMTMTMTNLGKIAEIEGNRMEDQLMGDKFKIWPK
jgi:hypothetical protein